MMRTVILRGDSQVNAIFLAMSRMPAVADRFRLLYVDLMESTQEPLRQEDLDECRIFFEQRGETPAFDRTRLPADCAHVSFPKLTFNLLWPFTCVNTYNRPEPPQYPMGRFPYGDAVILECLNSGSSKDEILSVVRAERWEAHWPDLDNALSSETARLGALDSACDVHIGAYILDGFRARRLFWAPDLPSNALLEELLSRLLQAGFGADLAILATNLTAIFSALGERDLLHATSLPIHPKVAEHFELTWYDPNERYRLVDQSMAQYAEYFEQMVDAAIMVRDAGAPAKVASAQRVAIVFGNCQADALALTLSRLRNQIKGLRVLYLPSYDKPGGFTPLKEEDVRACDVLFEQQDPREFPMKDALPAECRRIKFPSLDFNLLWPLSCINPYNLPELPSYPQGRFPYGNAVVVYGVEHGWPRDEILSRVLSEPWQDDWPNLDRLLSIESARLTARDLQCHVKMAPFVFEHFKSRRLFWAVNHPTNVLFAELCSRLLEVGFEPEIVRSVSVADVLRGIGTKDLLGSIGVPIQPHVAKHFELTWYDPEERYPFFEHAPVTHREYFESMIDASLEAARGRAVESSSLGEA